jgi:hypothetical protein
MVDRDVPRPQVDDANERARRTRRWNRAFDIAANAPEK